MGNWMEELWKQHACFITPIKINTDSEYRDALDKVFLQLEKVLIDINADDFFIQETQKYRENILFSIDKYYCGYISEAQAKIDQIINQFDGNNLAISSINNSISFGTNIYEQQVQFFRARCNEKIVDYSKKEMLHIPFSKRSKVKTERFSIPGLPCLYLGTTSYVCWLELGRPADHMFNVSPIILDNTQRILNLAINLKDFCSSNKYSEGDQKTIFQLFLLSIATSFKVKEENRTFKSEYIVSQLIMLACMRKGLSGVTYYSKQVDDDCFAHSVGVNLALFAPYSCDKDLSEICNHVFISDSFNYSMFKQLSIPQTFKLARLRVDQIGSIQNIGNMERQYPYRETKFYRFDHYLYAYCPPKELFNTDPDD